MHRKLIQLISSVLLFSVFAIPLTLAASRQNSPGRHPAGDVFGQLPVSFEANHGQTAPDVLFLSRGSGYELRFTSTEVLLLESGRQVGVGNAEEVTRTSPGGDNPGTGVVMKMTLVGSAPRPQVHGLDPLAGSSNYLIGSDPHRWLTNIPHFAKVEYQDVYPGISLIYYGNQKKLEYDFQLAPGANPQCIRVEFNGAKSLKVDEQGDLNIQVGDKIIRMERPLAYQQIGSRRLGIEARYVPEGPDQVRFELGNYDVTLPLVIDPVLYYSSYLGGSGNEYAYGIAVDSPDESIYLTGTTTSTDFPSVNPIQALPGGGTDAFVLKLNREGTELVYATYIGGAGLDRPRKIMVDGAGNAYVAGHTASPDFPTTSDSFQPTFQGGTQDGFILKLNPDGSSLLYSTFLGGTKLDQCLDLAVDPQGNAYVVGQTYSDNFPTLGLIQTSSRELPDAFVTKLNPAGSDLVYSTYLGGTAQELAEGIAVDSNGNTYVTGRTSSPDFPVVSALQDEFRGGSVGWLGFYLYEVDAFVTKINPAGTEFVYSTFLGGTGDDAGWQIAADSSGAAYVTGATSSDDFPVWNALQADFGGGMFLDLDAFVCKIDADGDLTYATYLGGSGDESSNLAGLALDAAGSVFVTGETSSDDFPIKNAWQPALRGWDNGFIAKLNPEGSDFVYSSYMGGSISDGVTRVTLDSSGNAILFGNTYSEDLPILNPLQGSLSGGSDLFVAKVSAENTQAGTEVRVVPIEDGSNAVPVTVTFSEVLVPGQTSLSVGAGDQNPPAGFLLGSPSTSYYLQTTATFAGSALVCIEYTGVDFVNESDLRLYHFEDGQWVDATVSLDVANKEICGEVLSFSPFVVAEDGFRALLTLVDQLSLATGQKNSLSVKILASQKSATAGHYTAASGQLEAFCNEVKGLSRIGRLDSGVAGFLTHQAQALRNTLHP